MNAKVERHLATNPCPVLRAAWDGTIIYSNKAGEPLLNEWGIDVGKKLPLSITDLVQRVSFQNSPEKIEVKTGKKVYLVVFHPLQEQNCVNISGFDISDQKILEARIQESEEKYRAVFENSIDAILITTPDGTIQEANSAACQMFKMSEEEIIQAGRDGLTDSSDPRLKSFIEKRARNGRSKGEHNHRRKNGTIFPGEVSSAFFKDKNGIIRTAMVIRDISERKKSEEALKNANDCLEEKVKEHTIELEKAYASLKESEKGLAEAQRMAHIGNWVWDIVTDKAYWSKELYRIFGRDTQKLAPTIDEFHNYIHPEDRHHYVNLAYKALDEKSSLSADFRIISDDGEERRVYIQSKVILNEANDPIQLRGIVQDITERKKAEETLRNFEIARKKEIHHRIKNNLQVISSLLDLQTEQFKNRDNIRDSEVLQAFKESQNRIISIAFIHEELHKGEGFEMLNFSSYVKELTDNLLFACRLGKCVINLHMDLGQNVFFNMDTAIPLGIIINELVSNSLEHAFPNKSDGIIRIKLLREKGSNISFALSISDNGVGIPFDLACENLNSLGLQLVTTLVDQLDGELELKRDNGTEFIIRFTVKEKDEQAKGIPTSFSL